MSLAPVVLHLQGENVSYYAKGDFIYRSLIELGLEEGGFITQAELIADPARVKGAVVVLADAYPFHQNAVLEQALRESHVLLAPSALNEEAFAHAESIGVTLMLPADQQKGFEVYIEKGTALLVDKIPATPLSDSLDLLEQNETGRAAIASMRYIVQDFSRHSFIYPPGHFSALSGGGKEYLTDKDVEDMIGLIEAESHEGGVLVVCGGRVDDDVADKLKVRFATYKNVEIILQNDQVAKADLPSAYTEFVRDSGVSQKKVFIDALARTTLEVIVESAGLSGDDGLSVITSERMIGNEKREKQVQEYFNTYGAKRVISLGKPWLSPITPLPRLPAPDLKTALHSWSEAKGFCPKAPTVSASRADHTKKNDGLQ